MADPRPDGPLAVGLEVGGRWVFATVVDWPGWCRRAKDADAAVAALAGYAERYRAVVPDAPGADAALAVTGEVPGDATTDFGAPGAIGPWDTAPMDAAECDRQVAVLEACWVAFDDVAASAPPALATGPRGGGRQPDAIVDHVRETERTYARKVGVAVPPHTPWPDQRRRIAEGLRAGAGGGGGAWPLRYLLRRLAWHVTDHLWEIEDRS